MSCDYCEPCKIDKNRQRLQQQPSKPVHYFYTEKYIDYDSMKKNMQSHPRSSSVENVKRSNNTAYGRRSSLDNPRKANSGEKPSLTCLCRPKNAEKQRPSSADNKKKSSSASADNKVNKKNSAQKSKNKSAKPECVDELKKDLKTIKQQLCALTVNREEAVEVTNELQLRYKRLMEKNEGQRAEIECLRKQNKKLLCELERLNESLNSSNVCEIVEAKKTLDDYSCKLSELYTDFMDAASVMGQSKEEVYKCLKAKEDEFRKMECLRQELTEKIQDKDEQLLKMANSYTKLKECQQKFLNENCRLSKVVDKLQNQVKVAQKDTEKLRKEAACNKLQQGELEERCKCAEQQLGDKHGQLATLKDQCVCFQQQIDDKNNQLENLKRTVEDLRKTQESNSDAAEHEDLKMQHQQLVCKYKSLLARFKVNEEKDRARFRELEAVKENEKCMCDEVCRIKKHAEDLCKMVDEGKMAAAKLKTVCQEKDSIIQCQIAELDYKKKEIECLIKNLEKFKLENAKLQETLAANNISGDEEEKCKNKNLIYASDHCCINLTDELQDLINALYEEIDKVCAKDQEIEKQHKNICCLKCALTSKDKELYCIRHELKLVQDQLNRSCHDKEKLIKSLKRLEAQMCSTEYEEEFECGYYGEEACQ